MRCVERRHYDCHPRIHRGAERVEVVIDADAGVEQHARADAKLVLDVNPNRL
jgi:hypothetical protein